MKTNESVNLKTTLQHDNVFVKNEIVPLSGISGLPSRRGLDRVIISDGEIVNVVSNSYGHLPNEKFFDEVERKLFESGVAYIKRSINRNNRSFAIDYILSDDRWLVIVNNGNDRLRPMLRFTNSYDGSCKTSGHFGFYREVCANGLHIAQSVVGFSVKHKGNIAQVIIPEIRSLVDQFMRNEFYSLHKKFEVLAEKSIQDLTGFVKITADHFKLFQYECSSKNISPSVNARLVIDRIQKESSLLNAEPNVWHGYNAFNAVLHDKLKKTFAEQRKLDALLFEYFLNT